MVHFGRHRETRVRPFQRALYFSQPTQEGSPAWLRFTADCDRAREVRGIFRDTLTRRSFIPERLRSLFNRKRRRLMKGERDGRLGFHVPQDDYEGGRLGGCDLTQHNGVMWQDRGGGLG